jgi:hypothetical protein
MAIAVEHGAQRVSVGGALAWTALRAVSDSAEAMRDRGDFSSLQGYSFVRELLG